MGKMKKKGESGSAVNYVTRRKAISMLQVDMKQFRRLCILKGVYPHVPAKKFKGNDKIYYLKKDIQHLIHEPVLQKMRDQAAFVKKYRKAEAKRDKIKVKNMEEVAPKINIDHLVKERFPTFLDAIRELDDALCHIGIFTQVRAELKDTDMPDNTWLECQRVMNEFHSYVVLSGSLKRAFLSLKGVYLQAEIFGEVVTWLLPYRFYMSFPKKVDMSVMSTFLHFYVTQLHFINYRLFNGLGMVYPPQLVEAHENAGLALAAVNAQSLSDKEKAAAIELARKTSAIAARRAEKKKNGGKRPAGAAAAASNNNNNSNSDDIATSVADKIKEISSNKNNEDGEDEEIEDINAEVQGDELNENEDNMGDSSSSSARLFTGLRFFLSREVPIDVLEIMIRSFGGMVGWQGEASPFDESDESITHQVVDRDTQRHIFVGREYVQPQWVVDSLNNNFLLPVDRYGIGKDLPPHLSPFVNDKNVGYVPEQRRWIEAVKQGKEVSKRKAPEDEGGSDEEEIRQAKSEHFTRIGDADILDEDDDDEEGRFEREIESELAGTTAEDAAAVAAKLMKKKKKKEAALAKVKKSEEQQQKEFAMMMLPNKQRKQMLKEMKTKKNSKKKNESLKKKRRQLEADDN